MQNVCFATMPDLTSVRLATHQFRCHFRDILRGIRMGELFCGLSHLLELLSICEQAGNRFDQTIWSQ